MRTIMEHRRHAADFDERVRSLVKNSPWWMTSLVAHLLALLLLAALQVDAGAREVAARLEASRPEPEDKPDPQDQVPPEPESPIEREVETPVLDPTDLAPTADPTESEDPATSGEEGFTTGPYDLNFQNPDIGLRGGRSGGRGPGGGRPGGGGGKPEDRRTDDAVELALRWLAGHQDVGTDGRWDCDDFMKHDPADDRCDGAGKAHYDAGVTGLALLAFLGAGYTDRGTEAENPFTRNVREGVRYLVGIQDDEGCFGTRGSQHFMYNHAIATLAMSEAFWMTRNPRYRKPAQDGLTFLAQARNPYLAWRYSVRGGDNDTSVTGWCVMALKSGRFANLDIDPDAFEGARQWIDRMTDPDTGKVGYLLRGGEVARPEGMQDRFPADRSESMTSVGLLTRIFLGEDPCESKPIRDGAALLLRRLPSWNPDDGSIDMYYWYYGTLAMFQVGGEPWKQWNRAMKSAILDHQHPRNSGRRTGSWDPLDPWGADGGRVYATAMLCTCLEVYYRYPRVFPYR